MAGKKGLKRRFRSDEEKRLICSQTMAPDVSVAQVARRYSLNASLIHKWLRDARFSLAVEKVEEEIDVTEEVTGFVPIEIESAEYVPGRKLPASVETEISPTPVPGYSRNAGLWAQRVEITLSDGRRILVEGSTTFSAVLALVEGLGE